MTHWPNDAINAVYILARGLWDIQKKAGITDDRGAYDLMCDMEAEMRERQDDPAQTDFRARLDLMDTHVHTLAGRV